MTNKDKLKKVKFDFSKAHYIDISDEHESDAGQLLDGYQAHNTTQLKSISWDNAHKAVDKLISENILHFKKKRTAERKVVKNALFTLLEEILGIINEYEQNCFILNNQDKFASIIQNAAQKYKEWRDKKFVDEENKIEYTWENQSEKDFDTEIYEKYDAKKYIYGPCYLRKDRTAIEKVFEKFIEDNDLIKCWYKNGDNGKEYFGIPYKENKKDKTFYPDFICKLYDDTVALFDTKEGITIQVAKEKAEALYKYCEENKMTGGIVRKDGTIWKVNYNETYDYNDNSQWKPFGDIYKTKKNYIINSERKSQ